MILVKRNSMQITSLHERQSTIEIFSIRTDHQLQYDSSYHFLQTHRVDVGTRSISVQQKLSIQKTRVERGQKMSVVEFAPLGVNNSPPRVRMASESGTSIKTMLLNIQAKNEERKKKDDERKKKEEELRAEQDLEWFKSTVQPVEETFLVNTKFQFPKKITIGPLTFLPRKPFIAGKGSYGMVGIYASGRKTVAVKAFREETDGEIEKGILEHTRDQGDRQTDLSQCWDKHLVASKWVASARGNAGWVVMQNLTGRLFDLLETSPKLSDVLLVLSHVCEALKCASYTDAVRGKCLFYADINQSNIMYAMTPELKGTLVDVGGFHSCSSKNSFVSTYPSPLTYKFSKPLSKNAGDIKDVPSYMAANILEHQQVFGLWSVLLYCIVKMSGLDKRYQFIFSHGSVKNISQELEKDNIKPTKLRICMCVYDIFNKLGIFKDYDAYYHIRVVLEVRVSRTEVSRAFA